MRIASFAAGPACRDAGVSLQAPCFAWHPAGDPGRPQVEAFIRRVYAERYGAQVRQFAPVLVSLREGEGSAASVVAAAGYRIATQPLFLEHYLDEPIERVLARQTEQTEQPARERIAEVGHLAATRAGEGQRLILRLAQHLAGLRVEWVVSTLTEELRHLFTRMGVVPTALGPADPARLGDGARDWGRYYEHHPVVLAGSLPLAMRRLAERLPAGER
ncbi:thermostable hemolysin [Methylibium sp.]|uniref:thermostable hemolysin n=1 Tax=Methylibium sp. TaxID=2067992 RepID=UPI003D0F21E7